MRTVQTHDVDADLRRYLVSRVVATVGSVVAAVVLPVLVYQLTGSAAWTAAVTVGEALPYLLFGLFAGAVADRTDRRRIMIGSDVLAAAVLATIPVAWWLGVLTPWQVLVAGALVQIAFVFFDAANFGALPTLVGKARLTEAYSRLVGATTIATLLVPPAAGLAVALIAPADLMVITVVTSLASALLVRSIVGRLTPASTGQTPASLLADIRSGLGVLWGNDVIRTLTLVGTAQSAAGGAFIAVLVPWADRNLGIAPSGDSRLGLLFACWGVGAFIASRLVPPLTARFGGARLGLGGLPVSLLTILAVAASPHWILALVAATAFGCAFTVVVLNAITYRQQATPDAAQSRVNTTARMLSWGIGQPAGAALAGFVATTSAGPRGGILAGAAVLGLGVALAWVTPVLRRAARATDAARS